MPQGSKRAKPKQPKPDVHDCATTRMHEAPKKAITTMPGGYIA